MLLGKNILYHLHDLYDLKCVKCVKSTTSFGSKMKKLLSVCVVLLGCVLFLCVGKPTGKNPEIYVSY